MRGKIVNKILPIFVAVVLLIVGVYAYAYISSIPNPGHGGDIIQISIDGSEMSLQEAIDNDLFFNLLKLTSASSVLNLGHSFNQIWVSIEGVEKTLQDAISTIGLCGHSSNPYSGRINPGHFASEVLVSISGVEMSLQDAVDSGKFCCVSHSYFSCYDNDVYWYDSCDNREEKKEECGISEYIGSNYCYDNDVYRDYITRGCSGISCTSSTSSIKQEECGANECSGGSCVEIILVWTFYKSYLESCYSFGTCDTGIIGTSCSTEGEIMICQGGYCLNYQQPTFEIICQQK